MSTDRPELGAADLDAMSPDERATALRDRVLRDLESVPDQFRQQVLATGARLAAERCPAE